MSLISELKYYKKYTFLSVLFHLLTAVFTLVSIPLVIPFFQIIFGASPSDYKAPSSWLDLEGTLNYGFSRLIAISDRSHALVVVCISVVAVFLMRNICRYLASYFMMPARNGLLKDLRSRLFEAYLKMPLSIRNKSHKGQLLSMMSNDINEIDYGILAAVDLLFKAPLVVIGSVLFMFWINIKLSIVAIILVSITVLVIGRLSHILKFVSRHIQDKLGAIQAISSEYLGGIKVIQSYNAEGFFVKRFAAENSAHYELNNRILRRRDLASPLSEFLAVAIIAYLLYFGAQMVFRQEILPATFFAFVFAFYNIIDPAKAFSREYFNVQKGIAALSRISDFETDIITYNDHKKGSISISSFKYKIEFKSLSFSHEGVDHDTFILRDLSFAVVKGEKIGIVGYSGSGKSTLIDLLLRFYIPDKGAIFLDNISIDEYKKDDYRRLFGLVTQDPQLFHMSIKENITLSDNELPPSFNDHMDLGSLSGISKIDQDRVGDEGIKLSGGERQRICIARALYHNPEIILLDEPTSSLDSESEQEVISSIHDLFEDRTIIMITHNTKLLSQMDRIIVLDRGRIVEQGTYDELKSLNGTFARLDHRRV